MNYALRDDASVRELISILDRNHSDTSGFTALLGYVQDMERQLDAAVSDLKEIRHEISLMREERNHPLRTAMQKMARVLETKINEAREKLGEIKDAIVQGCKNAVAAFKRRGITALSNLAAFFRIDPMLQAMKKSLTEGIVSNEQAMRRIDAMSAKYHKAGLHMKNAGRALRGKEAIQKAKPSGRVAKLAKSPFAAQITPMMYALRSVDKAIAGLERLNQKAKQQTSEKPSILKTMDEMKERVKQQAPTQAAAKSRDASL